MILVVGFLLIVSLVTSAMLAAVGRHLDPVLAAQAAVEAGNAVGGFLLVAFMFGLIYKVVPRQRVLAADVWLGALLAALLFTVGKVVIGAYIGRSGVASGFGAAGSLVVVLLWVYFSAQILLIGAEFTCVYARTFGSRSPRAPARAQRSDPWRWRSLARPIPTPHVMASASLRASRSEGRRAGAG